ncbi:MAG TPA: cell division protein FtsH, partial [Dehalococcoidia bacterium]|nr:cell division protein FtsH [Dehalococcoidia bacterium]
MKSGWKLNSLIYIAILIVAVAVFSYLFSRSQEPTEIPLSDAITMSQEGKIEKILIEDNTLFITTTDGVELETFKENNASIYDIEGLSLEGIVVEVKGSSGFNWGGLMINFLPLLLFGGLLFFLFRSARGANSQALSFGRSRARLFPASTPTVTFDDVAGVDEAKQELHEVVDFLK